MTKTFSKISYLFFLHGKVIYLLKHREILDMSPQHILINIFLSLSLSLSLTHTHIYVYVCVCVWVYIYIHMCVFACVSVVGQQPFI